MSPRIPHTALRHMVAVMAGLCLVAAWEPRGDVLVLSGCEVVREHPGDCSSDCGR